MFNFNIYERKQKQADSYQKLTQHFHSQKERQAAINTRLAINYKNRVESFITDMRNNPIIQSNYISSSEKAIKILRPDNSALFIGSSQFYLKGFKHEKDRIKDSLKRNENFDFSPTKVFVNFRSRDRFKEIQPDMHFKPKTSLERIESYLRDHIQSHVENKSFKEQKNSSLQIGYMKLPDQMSFQEKKAFISRQVAKNLLPSLHKKTHFKAVIDMSNNLPTVLGSQFLRRQKSISLFKNYEEPQEKIDEVHDENAKTYSIKIDKNKVEKTDLVILNLEKLHPQTETKEILIQCNVIKPKNPKVKQLKSGEGRLISTRDQSISEVYSIIAKDEKDHSFR